MKKIHGLSIYGFITCYHYLLPIILSMQLIGLYILFIAILFIQIFAILFYFLSIVSVDMDFSTFYISDGLLY